LSGAEFEKSVFINCPFDAQFEPILQAILFCTLYLGFEPRLALEQNDAGEIRLRKIVEIIKSSKYSVHDLSRSIATKKGEIFRLNMPFELGVDYGCREFESGDQKSKKFLILEERKYRYQAALSDIAGCDIEAHGGKFETAVSKLRNWLVNEAGAQNTGTTKIIGKYADFQQWYWETQLKAGASEEDIKDYPTKEVLSQMREWFAKGEPLTAQ
jgi:hypothetical protein